MGSKPRSGEDYVSRLVNEKERAIYWLCSLLERDSASTRAGARKALGDLGYDDRRIHSVLLLGEPGLRAGEDTHAIRPRDWGARGCAVGSSGAGRSRGTGAHPHGTLLEYGPGSG